MYSTCVRKRVCHQIYTSLLLLTILLSSLPGKAQTDSIAKQTLAAQGTSSVLGNIDGVSIEAMVQGPATETTDLQIVCLFEYTEGDIFNSPPALPRAVNGLVHLDEALHGLITDIRKNGRFAGHALETLLIIPPPNLIKAKKLLLIGLGDRTRFKPELMISVGSVGMREALRLGVSTYAHASDLKDAGIDSPTALVVSNVLKGAFDAYRTEAYLKSKKATSFRPLTKMTLLAGPSFYAISAQAIKDVIKAPGK